MRIVSLAPACTEWVAALDALGHLVARSHACDFPQAVLDLPAVTSRTMKATSSRSIFDEITRRADSGNGLLDVDMGMIADLKPDLILADNSSAADAPALAGLERSISSWPGKRPSIHLMQAESFKHVLNEALRLATAIERSREAMAYLAAMERRLAVLRNGLGIHKRTPPESLPSMTCVGWLDPLHISRRWIPDMVELAGGRPEPGTDAIAGDDPFAIERRHAARRSSVERSRKVLPEEDRKVVPEEDRKVVPEEERKMLPPEDRKVLARDEWAAVCRADPDVLALVPCAFDIKQIRTDLTSLTGRPGWRDLTAIKSDRVFAFDARAYFTRPGPRLYRGIELLAHALHPNRMTGMVRGETRGSAAKGNAAGGRQVEAVRSWEMEIVRSR